MFACGDQQPLPTVLEPGASYVASISLFLCSFSHLSERCVCLTDCRASEDTGTGMHLSYTSSAALTLGRRHSLQRAHTVAQPGGGDVEPLRRRDTLSTFV